jgi:hypothetical protein
MGYKGSDGVLDGLEEYFRDLSVKRTTVCSFPFDDSDYSTMAIKRLSPFEPFQRASLPLPILWVKLHFFKKNSRILLFNIFYFANFESKYRFSEIQKLGDFFLLKFPFGEKSQLTNKNVWSSSFKLYFSTNN